MVGSTKDRTNRWYGVRDQKIHERKTQACWDFIASADKDGLIAVTAHNHDQIQMARGRGYCLPLMAKIDRITDEGRKFLPTLHPYYKAGI